MAEFKSGDRVVKMSGAAAGKYGTVNSVAENGTLNVTFDGERLPRYCDPERCGQVATNAKFKVGDKVWVPSKQKRGVVRSVSATGNQYDIEFMGGGGAYVNEDGLEYLQPIGRAANAKGERVIYDLIVNPVGRDKFRALQRIGMTIKQAQRGVDIVQKWQTKSVREEDAANGDMSRLNEIWKRNAEGCAAELEAMRKTVNSRA